MANEKKPVKDPNKKQGAKRSKKVGHKIHEKTFKDAKGNTYTKRRHKGNRSHNEDARDWGKLDPKLRELSKTIRKFDGKKILLDADVEAVKELTKGMVSLSEA